MNERTKQSDSQLLNKDRQLVFVKFNHSIKNTSLVWGNSGSGRETYKFTVTSGHCLNDFLFACVLYAAQIVQHSGEDYYFGFKVKVFVNLSIFFFKCSNKSIFFKKISLNDKLLLLLSIT